MSTPVALFWVLSLFAVVGLLFIIFHKVDDIARETRSANEGIRVLAQILEQIRRGDKNA